MRAKVKGKSWIKAKKVEIDGIEFASLAEGRRYEELKLLALAKEIYGLACHTQYPLIINGIQIGRYTDDFSYYPKGSGIRIVEDVKGWTTPVARLRMQVFAACYHEFEFRVISSRKPKKRGRKPKAK